MKWNLTALQKKVVVALALFCSLYVGWCLVKPEVYLIAWAFRETKDQTPESEQTAVKHLASAGPRIIAPVIATIRKETPWSKSTVLLPFVLAELGEPAHQRLLDAIKEEKEPHRQAYLIYALQSGFEDYSCLPLYLDAVETGPGRGGEILLREQLMDYQFIHANEIDMDKLVKIDPKGNAMPDIVVDAFAGTSKINPDFVKWYQLISKPNGPLPPWRPKQQHNQS